VPRLNEPRVPGDAASGADRPHAVVGIEHLDHGLDRLHVGGEPGGFLATGVDPATDVGMEADLVGNRRMS
jgi:hypothetical protein